MAGEPVMVQRKKKPSGARRKCQRKQEKRMLPHRLTLDRELEAPTVANRALGLMLILGVAVTQKDRCHLVGHLRMPRARCSVLSRNRQKQHLTVRDLLRFLTSSRTLVRNTRGFTGGWTMGPSAAWFYEGQLRPH